MRLLRGVWKLLVGVKDALVLLAMLLFFGLLYIGLSASPNPANTAQRGALLVDLDGTLVEQTQDIDPVGLLTDNRTPGEYRQRDLIRVLRAAAHDANVKAVVLDLDRFSGGGQATIAEAAAALDDVRRAQKPVLAFATGYTDNSYQLAAHASEIWLDPLGAVLIAGPGGSHLYYKGLLDKLGVTANIYRVGTYKSAVEPFSRSDQSPEARAAAQALIGDLWKRWQDDVSAARPKMRLAAYIAAPEQAITAAGGNVAQAARAAGLVDRIGDRQAFQHRVAEIVGADDGPQGFQSIALDGYAEAHPENGGGDAVGVLTIAGDIVDGQAGGGTAGGDTIADLLANELDRDRIKALVLRIDSPGGSVTAAERIRGAILAARAQGLPVVASMGSVAASGGYWVATSADRIYAEPSTITGSIGVFGIIPTFAGTLQKLGLSADGVKTTPLSGEPDVLKGTSPEFDRLVQLGIEDIYRRFVGLVAHARGISPAAVDQIGQGRVWSGDAARANRLIDGFGSLDTAIAEAGRLAKLDPARVRPLFIERSLNPFEKALRDMARSRRKDDASDARDAWTQIAQRPQALLIQALADTQSIVNGPMIQIRCIECGGATPAKPAVDVRQGVLRMIRMEVAQWLS